MIARPASDLRSSGSTERISRQVAVTLMVMTLSNTFASTWPIGEIVPRMPALATKYVELPPPVVDGGAQAIDGGHVGEVERHECRLAFAGPGALGLDLIIEVFKTADRARDRDDMRAGRRHLQRDLVADAARRAGDEGSAVGEVGNCHKIHLCRPSSALRDQARSMKCFKLAREIYDPPAASSDKVRTLSCPSKSSRRVGYWAVKQASQNCGWSLSRAVSPTAR